MPGRCGVDLPEPPAVKSRLGGVTREGAIGLPGLSEPQVVRQLMDSPKAVLNTREV